MQRDFGIDAGVDAGVGRVRRTVSRVVLNERTVARAMGRLTALGIQRNNKPGLYADGQGLVLQVRGPSSKSWIFRYRLNGREREMGLGPLHTVSLAEARDLALQARKLKLSGIDPIEERRERLRVTRSQTKQMTFDECVAEYLRLHEVAWGNAKHRTQWRTSLETYASPHFGAYPIDTVDLDAVMNALEPIWMEKPETASRVRGRIETILDWAKVRGLRGGENPAAWKGNLARLLPARSKVRSVKHHAAMPYADLPSFMRRLEQRDGTAALALQFTILTAARTGEVTGATWSEVNQSTKAWTIPARRMKAQREHRVPLTDAALKILNHARGAAPESQIIFANPESFRPLSNTAMTAVMKRLGQGDFTVHGFRSAFRDWAAETTSYPNEVIEMALAHTIGSRVEAAYRRGDLFEKRRALMQDWTQYLGLKA